MLCSSLQISLPISSPFLSSSASPAALSSISSPFYPFFRNSMELLHQLLLTALIAVFFSFLIAKLVAMAMAVADSSRTANPNVDQVTDANTREDVQMFGERLLVDKFKSDEKRVEFVAEKSQSVSQFFEGSGEVEEIEKSVTSDEVNEAECCELPSKSLEEFSERDNKLPGVISRKDADEYQLKREFGVNFTEDQRTIKQPLEEVIEEKETVGDDNLIKQKAKLGTEISVSKDVCEESDEIQADRSEAQKIIDERKIEIDSDDDDWEGIERSELENIFAKATKFMDNEELTSAGSDVQMQLYGLHKVATEGPCREQAPMPLKVAARAKCDGEQCFHCARNAWQRLGNMSPEVAMEQYVALVSDNIPGWKEDRFDGDGKIEPLEVAAVGVVASDTSTPSDNHPRQSEIAEDIPSAAAKNYLSGKPILESLAEE